MSEKLLVAPPHHADGFVMLSRSPQGRLFEKHILSLGVLHYPGVAGGQVTIDQDFADKLVTNFKNKVCPIVQIPKADAKNQHSEDPDRNIGEVVDLTVRDGKIYATLDVRSEEDADRVGKTLLGASAMLSLNYVDTRTGKGAGPTLLHVAVTNRPHIVDLEEYQEIIAASADSSNDVKLAAHHVEEKAMTLEEMLSALKADHNIDVAALQASAASAEASVSLSNAIKENLADAGILKLSNNGEPSTEDLVSAVVEAGAQILSLSNTLETERAEVKKTEANHRVESEIRAGRILPKDKDAQVELLLSNADIFERLLPETPLVKLSQEDGIAPVDTQPASDIDAEIARYSELANGK